MRLSSFLLLAATVLAGARPSIGQDSSPTPRQLPSGPPPPAGWVGGEVKAGKTGIILLWVPPGAFLMGDPDNPPQRRVRITRGFWIGKFEVTQRQWKALVGENPSYDKNEGGDAPVEGISWLAAAKFCKTLSLQEGGRGKLPPGYEYRLPTEAEWEYACRAGTTGDYAGDGVLDDMGWYLGHADGRIHAVGEKKPNAWGLYDMHGNVWEWCNDWYGPYPSGDATDPIGPPGGKYRVDRGGSYFHDASDSTSAARGKREPTAFNDCLGLRVALAPTLGT